MTGRRPALRLGFVALLAFAGCKETPPPKPTPTTPKTAVSDTASACQSSVDCDDASVCVDGTCVPRPAAPRAPASKLPAVDKSCSRSEDCVLTKFVASGKEMCGDCSCDEQAVASAWLIEAKQTCKAMAAEGHEFPGCVPKRCAPPPIQVAACVHGECTVAPRKAAPQIDIENGKELVFPPNPTACDSDNDCTVSSFIGNGSCCRGCTRRAFSKNWLAEAKATCSEAPRKCPRRKCRSKDRDYGAKCVDNECYLVGDEDPKLELPPDL